MEERLDGAADREDAHGWREVEYDKGLGDCLAVGEGRAGDDDSRLVGMESGSAGGG